MAAQVLWRKLTHTDFNAINAEASPFGHGGGARHISLGVRSVGFPIDDFLLSPGRSSANVVTPSDKIVPAPGRLSFISNVARRGGEWYISDQYNHRHPAWTAAAGFPSTWNPGDVPYVLVFRVGDVFYARHTSLSDLKSIAPNAPPRIQTNQKGIAWVDPEFLKHFHLHEHSLLDSFDDQALAAPVEDFNPADISDGRKKVFASILRRQGQKAFREALLKAYGTKCAMTGNSTTWVLEAAHISPYMGKETNRLANGLLLRADVHTLFDLGLISIDPLKRTILVSGKLADSNYANLSGRKLREPVAGRSRPSDAALRSHRATFVP